MRKHEINKRKKASQKRKSFGKKEEKKVRRKISCLLYTSELPTKA